MHWWFKDVDGLVPASWTGSRACPAGLVQDRRFQDGRSPSTTRRSFGLCQAARAGPLRARTNCTGAEGEGASLADVESEHGL